MKHWHHAVPVALAVGIADLLAGCGGGHTASPASSPTVSVEMKAMGFAPVRPPSADASKIETLQALWTDAGVVDVETRRIDVQRSFVDFDDFWTAATLGMTIGPQLASMAPDDVVRLKLRVRAHLKEDGAGRITYRAWANAIKGRVPG